MKIERLDFPTDQKEFERIIDQGHPVIFENCGLADVGNPIWGLEGMGAAVGEARVKATILDNYVFRADEEKGHYYPEQMKSLTLREFLDDIRLNQGKYHCLHRHNLDEVFPSLKEHIAHIAFVQGSPFYERNLWISGKGSVTFLHHDFAQNLYLALKGARKIYLAPVSAEEIIYRSEIRKNMNGTTWHSSRLVSCQTADQGSFPKFNPKHIMELVLTPGQLLHIPRFWWHELHALEEINVNISFWWEDIPLERIKEHIGAFTAFGEALRGMPPYWKDFSKALFGAS